METFFFTSFSSPWAWADCTCHSAPWETQQGSVCLSVAEPDTTVRSLLRRWGVFPGLPHSKCLESVKVVIWECLGLSVIIPVTSIMLVRQSCENRWLGLNIAEISHFLHNAMSFDSCQSNYIVDLNIPVILCQWPDYLCVCVSVRACFLNVFSPHPEDHVTPPPIPFPSLIILYHSSVRAGLKRAQRQGDRQMEKDSIH